MDCGRTVALPRRGSQLPNAAGSSDASRRRARRGPEAITARAAAIFTAPLAMGAAGVTIHESMDASDPSGAFSLREHSQACPPSRTHASSRDRVPVEGSILEAGPVCPAAPTAKHPRPPEPVWSGARSRPVSVSASNPRRRYGAPGSSLAIPHRSSIRARATRMPASAGGGTPIMQSEPTTLGPEQLA